MPTRVSHGVSPWVIVQSSGPRTGILGWVIIVQYESINVSHKKIVQIGNKGKVVSGTKGSRQKKRSLSIHQGYNITPLLGWCFQASSFSCITSRVSVHILHESSVIVVEEGVDEVNDKCPLGNQNQSACGMMVWCSTSGHCIVGGVWGIEGVRGWGHCSRDRGCDRVRTGCYCLVDPCCGTKDGGASELGPWWKDPWLVPWWGGSHGRVQGCGSVVRVP